MVTETIRTFEQSVLYRDEHLMVVDKPSGLLVHRGWARDEVVSMTLARDAIGQWVYPVHRLDRGTSGVLLFALDSSSAALIQEQFVAGEVTKRYWALVRGVPPESGVIDNPVPRKPKGDRVPAVTEFRRLAVFENRYSWIEVLPKTGRLHQIRRHMKHISCPLIGDVRYGKGEHNRLFRERGLQRLALHACELTLQQPVTGEPLSFRAALPSDLAEPLAAMGLKVDGLEVSQ